MKTMHSTEVVVVGAGAVGCSIAYWLAKRGKDVTLVDKNGPATGTSVANFGQVWTSSKEPYTYMELNLRSSWLWPRMIEELGEDVDYRRGGLEILLTEEDCAAAEEKLERQSRSRLFRGRIISPPEVWDMQPGISREIAGAIYCPDDGDSDPIKWTYALLLARCYGLVFLLGPTLLVACGSYTHPIGVGAVAGFEKQQNEFAPGVILGRDTLGVLVAVLAELLQGAVSERVGCTRYWLDCGIDDNASPPGVFECKRCSGADHFQVLVDPSHICVAFSLRPV